jgi:pyridoxine 5-phosphate synthase
LHAAGIHSSLFIDADPGQIESAREIGAEYVEIHTGHFAAAKDRRNQAIELQKITRGVALAREAGLKVNLGHGLNYVNILQFAHTPGICEYSIGHSIMARAIFVGISQAVRDMADIIRTFPR